MAGNKLDAEADVLYYTGDDGCQYTFRPAAGSTVTLLRPTLTETAMTYTGGFGTDGVTTKGGDVTLTLTEGKNIVKISKDGADTYQVITVKKAGVVITNKTDPTRDILPGDTVTVQLTGVYHPANTMANLYSLFAYVSYTDPGSSATVTGDKYFYQRHLFDRADGDSCRTVLCNAKTLYLADREEFGSLPVHFVSLLFTTEDSARCAQVLSAYLGEGEAKPADFTRGLYTRGVL